MDAIAQNGHKRAVIYARVSTDEQRGNTSPGEQVRNCLAYAARQGFVVVGNQFVDPKTGESVSPDTPGAVQAYVDDYTGTVPIEARPEGRKAFTLLKSSDADCLIANETTRLARPPEDGDEWDTPLLIRGLAKSGKDIHTVQRGQLKTDLPSLLMALFDARSAGDEWRKIIERTSGGRYSKARAGRVVGSGKPPYSYRFVYTEVVNPKTGTRRNVVTSLTIDESEAGIIRIIFHWYTIDLLSGHEIAQRLTAQHITTPGESRGYKRKQAPGVWEKATVYSILANELYCGVWKYGKYNYVGVKRGVSKRKKRDDGESIEIGVPPVISRAMWEQAQQRRKDGKKTSRRNLHFSLTGRIECGCSHAMIGCANGGGRLYYACGSIQHHVIGTERVCFERHVRADAIEGLAWEFALQSKKSAVEFVAMLKEYQETQQAQIEPLARQIAEIKELIAITGRKIKRLASLRGSANDDEEAAQYTADLEAAKAEKIGLEHKLSKLEAAYKWEDTLTDDDIIAVLQMREADVKRLQGADFDERRRYLAKIDLRVVVKDRVATFACKLPVPDRMVDLDARVVESGVS